MGVVTSTSERDALLRDRLRELASLPLLSDAEEIAAAAVMADGRAAENELAGLGGESQIDLMVAARLNDRVHAGEQARADLIGSTRRLVVSIARRHICAASVTHALLAAGDEAVGRAADRYDPAGSLPFSAFARWWIERAMREVDLHPAQGHRSPKAPADPTMLTALGHLHREDTRVIELRLGLHGGPALSEDETAHILGIDQAEEAELEELAVAKLRHPSTPGDLTHLRSLD